MSRAKQCDVCNRPVTTGHCVTLEVMLPNEDDGETSYSTWSDFDICADCCAKSFAEILETGLEGFGLFPAPKPSEDELTREESPHARS